MARLKSLGFELNSTATGVEFNFVSGANAPTIQTTIVRSGTYAATQTNSGGNDGALQYQFRSTNATEAFYFRVYVYITAAPNTTSRLLTIWRTSTTARKISIRLTNGRALQLFNEEDAAQIGSDSSALSLNTWYRVELKVDTTTIGSTAVEARVDGSSFASGTMDLTSGIAIAIFGLDTLLTSGSIRMDDIAINDATGSFQNSWPGEGEIIHLRPNAAGDTNTFATGSHTDIDEVTPDDATTTAEDDAAGTLDVNLDATPAAMDSSDTINVVHVGVRFRSDSTTDPDPTFVLRVKAAASGTVEESASITSSSTSWNTNAVAEPKNYPLTLYDLPGASTTAWTKADLDTTQIGVRETNSPFPNLEISTMWLLVDHKPTAAPATSVKDVIGMGFIPFARS